MKTRPHIVTQTREYDTAALQRNTDLLAARMGDAGSVKNIIGYSRVLIRIMKIILDLTLHNDCFTRRRDVLESSRLRQLVMERLGGAHALLLWRRQNTWNTARLAAIASGEYRPIPEPQIPMTAKRPKPAGEGERRKVKTLFNKPASRPSGPAKFRLPVLQNLRYVRRPRPRVTHRAKPETRYPCVVLWPHELDGQYVPNFVSKATRPASGFPPVAPAGFKSVTASAPPPYPPDKTRLQI